MVFEILITLAFFLLFIYCLILSSILSDFKHQKELEMKDVCHDMRERLSGIDGRVGEASRKLFNQEYDIQMLKGDVRALEARGCREC